MATAAKASTGAIAACIALGAFSLLLWTLLLPSLANLAGSDAASNALQLAFSGAPEASRIAIAASRSRWEPDVAGC